MPSKSKAQHNAMEAAAHGKSTIGIPAKVAKEFVEADKKDKSYKKTDKKPAKK